MRKKVYLIGMPGAGKTTFGKATAAIWGVPFRDLDWEIADLAGKSIAQLFEEDGEAQFRKLERKALHLLPLSHGIVSTGGGLPCFFDNMAFMNQNGISVYLKVEVPTLCERILSQKGQRPTFNDMDRDELRKSILEKYNLRKADYEKAHIQISGEDLDIPTFSQRLKEAIGKL